MTSTEVPEEARHLQLIAIVPLSKTGALEVFSQRYERGWSPPRMDRSAHRRAPRSPHPPRQLRDERFNQSAGAEPINAKTSRDSLLPWTWIHRQCSAKPGKGQESRQPICRVLHADRYRKADVKEALELAYALTVHKAQGSDFQTVILVLPRKAQTLSRELSIPA